MMSKSVIYGLVGLLAGSTITALSVTSSSRAEQNRQLQPAASCVTKTMPHHMVGIQEIDKHFIEMMIPHHQQAVEMADLALQKAKNPEIKKLAAAIKTDQTQEIEQMKAWYKQWYGVEVPANSTNMGMHHAQGQGMSRMPMHSPMMGMHISIDSLKNASDFDKEFVRQMIPHHESAVMMAQMVGDRANHTQIRDLAQAIIKSQTAEIQQMQQWYQTWS
ncbi:DUF305 domain-containing protein [Calothrix sp. FACHB-156]|nr:DUF305 domain-containing protein [Calothrix sp. FACHB-156]